MGQYLQPISSWATAILEERENNKLMNLYRTPFAVMSSAALVTKFPTTAVGKELENEITNVLQKGPKDPKTFYGCIISNNVNDLGLSYSPNETPVGVDFEGKVIKVENETGRKVSTPIIISIDVDSEEANNTIKTTRIGVRCFTLKQLEMFEMFFMKPGMSVMVEWGDSSLLKRDIFKSNLKLEYWDSDIRTYRPIIPLNSTTDALFIKEYPNWEKYCENFSDVFVPNVLSLRKILEKVRRTIGSYDFAAGKISDYSYSVNEDGTYDVSLTIFQMNQVSLAVPVKPSNKGTSKPANPQKSKSKRGSTNTSNTTSDNIQKIRQKILVDFNLEDNDKLIINYKNDWFNFFQDNDKQQNTQCSIEPYISLKFILGYLTNYIVTEEDKQFKFELPKYNEVTDDGKPTGVQLEIIPFTYDKALISSNEDILFPVKNLPQFELDNQKKPTKIQINTNTGKNRDGSINGKSILLDKNYQFSFVTSQDTTILKANEFANALNCFISYKRVLGLWGKSVTRIDFIKNILDMVNTNSYGLMNLVLAPPADGLPVTVICSRCAPDDIKKILEKGPSLYRFKPNTINSTVKNFSFNFQMGNLMAGRTIFNSNANLRKSFEAIDKNDVNNAKKIKELTLDFPPENYRSAHIAKFTNADNYYSINWADKIAQEKIWKQYQKKFSTGITGSQSSGEIEGLETKTTNTNTSGSLTNLIIESKSVKFINGKNDNKPTTFIYKDQSLIQDKIEKFEDKKEVRSILTNITISITIDGFSGLRAGEVFHTDGVPEIYNKQGVFVITNIKHNITPDDGWTTTIEAGWRVMNLNK